MVLDLLEVIIKFMTTDHRMFDDQDSFTESYRSTPYKNKCFNMYLNVAYIFSGFPDPHISFLVVVVGGVAARRQNQKISSVPYIARNLIDFLP